MHNAHEYDYLLADPDVTYYRDKLPRYDRLVRQQVGYCIAQGVTPHDTKAVLLQALRDALRAYSQTPHTTRTGRALRVVAGVLSYLNPLTWFR